MLSFPTINVKRPLIVGIGDSSLARGLGLWPDTAVPGDPGNAVIAGHRTSHGAPMRYIDRLKIGDPIYFTTTGPHPTTYEFRITKRQVVRPNALWITRQSVASTLTIFACHPPHSIAYRFVVFAKLVTDAQHAGR
jgi:sortase A